MIIIYIDILLLAILLILLILTCGYCMYRVYSLQRSGQVTILLRPTKVLFSHKKEGEVNDQLSGEYIRQPALEQRGDPSPTWAKRPMPSSGILQAEATVVAYQNPFTGDYCVHKSRGPKGYVNSIESPDSIDSGVSDAYEPLNLVPQPRAQEESGIQESIKAPISPVYDNSLNKTWKWNYTEYQI